MEYDHNGIWPQWKTNSMEDNLNGRQEDDLNGVRLQWKMTSMEDDYNGRQPQIPKQVNFVLSLAQLSPSLFDTLMGGLVVQLFLYSSAQLCKIIFPNSAQAKPKLNFSLAELWFFSENPTTTPPLTDLEKFISKPAWGKSQSNWPSKLIWLFLIHLQHFFKPNLYTVYLALCRI